MRRLGWRHAVIVLVIVPLLQLSVLAIWLLWMQGSTGRSMPSGIFLRMAPQSYLYTSLMGTLSLLPTLLASSRPQAQAWWFGLWYGVIGVFIALVRMAPLFTQPGFGQTDLLRFYLPILTTTAISCGVGSLLATAGYAVGSLIPMREREPEARDEE